MQINDKKFIKYVENWLDCWKSSEYNFLIAEAENILEIKEVTPENVLHLLRSLHYHINIEPIYKKMTKAAVYSGNIEAINKTIKVQLEHEYMYEVLAKIFTWKITYKGDDVEAIIKYKDEEIV